MVFFMAFDHCVVYTNANIVEGGTINIPLSAGLVRCTKGKFFNQNCVL